jgi:hypothetical protein
MVLGYAHLCILSIPFRPSKAGAEPEMSVISVLKKWHHYLKETGNHGEDLIEFIRSVSEKKNVPPN